MNDVTHVNNEYSNGIFGPNGSNRLDEMSKKTRPTCRRKHVMILCCRVKSTVQKWKDRTRREITAQGTFVNAALYVRS
jgi:hypothetical protein